jgi:two-component system sensor histidine kinase UhpB
MSLRLKINAIVGALTLAFLAAVIGLQFHNLRAAVHEEVVAANRVAAQLLNRTAWRYAAQGTPAMLAFLQDLGRIRSNDISLLDAQGLQLYQSPPSPYKAGRDAPAWFTALIAPAPSAQSIAFPDGKLVVQANASRAVLDAWDEIGVLAAVALGLLVLVNALVFWLVGRTVRPFGQIVAALDAMQAGRLDVALPALPGTEAAAIGAAFNRMTRELQGQLATERRALRAELQLSDSRELRRGIEQHIEQERRLIARELHDELGQSVTAMRSMALSVAQRAGTIDAQAERAAHLIADECSRLYEAMHGIIPRLAPLVLDSLGLAEALDDLVQRSRRSHPAVAIDSDVALPTDRELPPELALTLYRGAQEGLTNALRHGQAQQLKLRLWADAQALHLCLDDDGVGLPSAAPAAPEPGRPEADAPTRSGHYGLRWLAERAQSLQGSLQLSRIEPHGTRLQLQIPLPPNPQSQQTP